MAEDALIRELSAAVERSPDALELRLHLAELLMAEGRYAEALSHCSAALTQDSANAAALTLLQRCSAALAAPVRARTPRSTGRPPKNRWRTSSSLRSSTAAAHRTAENERDFDVLAPSDVKLADVAGMDDVKTRLEVSLLGPIRNPELMRAYKMSTRGGLLLYGPPGCGKTFLAKAVSGELGANFYPVGISDVLQQWLGNSERAVHEIFEMARRNSPCVLFFDEVDALGYAPGQYARRLRPTERSSTRYSPRRIRRHRTTQACTCWVRRTCRGMSIRRCAGPGASTG